MIATATIKTTSVGLAILSTTSLRFAPYLYAAAAFSGRDTGGPMILAFGKLKRLLRAYRK
ncbi:MAG: hypothetical protein DME78_01135 [Verrucomicrobia bacterium]|nr:MAG: hypothetical protein DME78_01135 [Verrucomicrobiota bacterium]